MLVSQALLIRPPHNRIYATFAIALSVWIFAYSSFLGQLPILIYYGLWLPLLVLDQRILMVRPGALLLPLAFAALIVASTFWSPVAGSTLRGGLQFATHVLCAIVAARVVDIGGLTRGVILGAFLVVLYSLLFGTYAYDVIDESYTFVGAFGSKNQLGLFCSLGMFFSVVFALVIRAPRIERVVAWLLFAFFAFTLASSHSTTSIISVVVALAAFLILVLLLRFPPQARNMILFLSVPCMMLLAFVAVKLGAVDSVLGAFGKDATLTGRTYLWTVGMAAGDKHPLLGAGYHGYWVQGFSEAERLWEEFYITSRSGFHFHNSFIEAYVELGLAGVAILMVLLLATLLRLAARVVALQDTEAAVLFGLFLLFLVRSFTEVDFLYPYTIGGFLLMFLAVSACRRPIGLTRSRFLEASGSPFDAYGTRAEQVAVS